MKSDWLILPNYAFPMNRIKHHPYSRFSRMTFSQSHHAPLWVYRYAGLHNSTFSALSNPLVIYRHITAAGSHLFWSLRLSESPEKRFVIEAEDVSVWSLGNQHLARERWATLVTGRITSPVTRTHTEPLLLWRQCGKKHHWQVNIWLHSASHCLSFVVVFPGL